MKTAQRFRGKHFCPIFVKNVVVIGEKHDAHYWQNWNFAQRQIRPCSSIDFKTTFLLVALFRVQISPKYFHSLKPQNHMKFNSSQIFEAHPSTNLLKFLLTPLLLWPLFNLSPNIYQKWNYFPNISLWNNCCLGKWGQRGKFLNCSYSMGIDTCRNGLRTWFIGTMFKIMVGLE